MNADNLQNFETLGYKMATSWFELDIHPYFVRRAVIECACMAARTPGELCVSAEQSPERWREFAKSAHGTSYAYVCATMAGCELAIEEWETKHEN